MKNTSTGLISPPSRVLRFCPCCATNISQIKTDGMKVRFCPFDGTDLIAVETALAFSLIRSTPAVTERRKVVRKHRTISDADRARAWELRDQGKSKRNIAKEIKRAKSTVYEILAEPRPKSVPARAAIHSCPECKKGPFTPQGLGAHRKTVHGIDGTGRTTLRIRSLAQPDNQLSNDIQSPAENLGGAAAR